MKFDFLKLKQVASLPYFRSKFLATFFTTLITATINIARDNNGILYVSCHKLYHNVLGENIPTSEVYQALISTAIIFIKCLDVALSVIIIFGIFYFFVSIVQNRMYSKRFQKRREYLKELLWENIIPNIIEMNRKEIELINVEVDPNGLDEKNWIITASALADLHIDLSTLVLRRGVFEQVESDSTIRKHYLLYLKTIKLPLVHIIFQQEKETIKNFCSILEAKSKVNNTFNPLLNNYVQIYQNYNTITNLIDGNITHKDIKASCN